MAKGALGLVETTIMGIAGTAPAFSLAATTAALVAAVGIMAPASILYCGIIMFGITLSFMYLNKINVNAGASYSWVSQIFGNNLGFFAGWALIVASTVFMVSAVVPAATGTLLFFAPHLVDSTSWVAFIGILWLAFVSVIILKGIKPTSYSQIIMTIIELAIMVATIIGSIVYFGNKSSHEISLSIFSIFNFTPASFAEGALIAIFFYWGWDVTMNLSEETKNSENVSSKASFFAMIALIIIFVLFIICVLMVLSDVEIENSNTNVIFAMMDKIFPRPWSYLGIIAVILSCVGTLETQILQFTRTVYSKSRDNSIHPMFSRLHKSWKTPYIATILIWLFGTILIFFSSYFPTVGKVIETSVSAIGFQVAFYYSLAGYACAWYYRNKCKNTKEKILLIIWPTISASFLVFIAVYSAIGFDLVKNIIGVGGILIGFIPLLLNKLRKTKLQN